MILLYGDVVIWIFLNRGKSAVHCSATISGSLMACIKSLREGSIVTIRRAGRYVARPHFIWWLLIKVKLPVEPRLIVGSRQLRVYLRSITDEGVGGMVTSVRGMMSVSWVKVKC